MSLLRKCVIDLEARHKGTVEEYFSSCYSPFMKVILVESMPEKLKILQLTGYEEKGDLFSHLNKYTS